MSTAADRTPAPQLPAAWQRLDRAARETAAALAAWRRRALEAEEEAARLRVALEELAAREQLTAEAGEPEESDAEELLRLRAENLALRSRMGQARRRVGVLLRRLAALEAREGREVRA